MGRFRDCGRDRRGGEEGRGVGEGSASFGWVAVAGGGVGRLSTLLVLKAEVLTAYKNLSMLMLLHYRVVSLVVFIILDGETSKFFTMRCLIVAV